MMPTSAIDHTRYAKSPRCKSFDRTGIVVAHLFTSNSEFPLRSVILVVLFLRMNIAACVSVMR
jgi:hypothetical protein